MKPEAKATALFNLGVDKARAFDRGMKQVRRDGIDAAFAFMQARELVGHGDWGMFCEAHSEDISPRAVRFWCQLAEEAIAWVRQAKPELKLVSEIQSAARDLVMQSPKPLIALCRELGHMRKFGEYDAVKYATKKLASSSSQIEFDFDKVFSAVDLLAHIGEDNYVIKYPENKDETEALRELRDKMAASVKRLDQIIEHGRVVEI